MEEIKEKLSIIDTADELTLNRMKDITQFIKKSDLSEVHVDAPQDDRTLQEVEKDMISQTLKKYYGSKRKTAQALGMSERTLYRKIKEYDLSD